MQSPKRFQGRMLESFHSAEPALARGDCLTCPWDTRRCTDGRGSSWWSTARAQRNTAQQMSDLAMKLRGPQARPNKRSGRRRHLTQPCRSHEPRLPAAGLTSTSAGVASLASGGSEPVSPKPEMAKSRMLVSDASELGRSPYRLQPYSWRDRRAERPAEKPGSCLLWRAAAGCVQSVSTCGSRGGPRAGCARVARCAYPDRTLSERVHPDSDCCTAKEPAAD
jgi:hypothetical protein